MSKIKYTSYLVNTTTKICSKYQVLLVALQYLKCEKKSFVIFTIFILYTNLKVENPLCGKIM